MKTNTTNTCPTSKYAGHSPSPWHIGGEYSSSQDEVESADGATIAAVWTRRNSTNSGGPRPCYHDTIEGKANIALITDAPTILAQRDELLAALRAIDEAMPDSSSPKDMALFAAGLQNAASAAIASVEGGAA